MVKQAAKGRLRKVQVQIRDSGVDQFDSLQVQTDKRREEEILAEWETPEAPEEKETALATTKAKKPNLKTRRKQGEAEEAVREEALTPKEPKATPPTSLPCDTGSTATKTTSTTVDHSIEDEALRALLRRMRFDSPWNLRRPTCTQIPDYGNEAMAEPQPQTTSQVPLSNDVEEETPAVAKSAEDRKAAAALSSLDKKDEGGSTSKDVDQEAVKKAMERLAGGGGIAAKSTESKEKSDVKKVVKVDAGDVALVVSSIVEGRA
jgi:hypothetical protein